jgi:ribulose-phosphate 3-epimerase
VTRVKIAPSILAADYRRLGEQVEAAEAAGVDYIHCDIMDGHFVPPITFGPLIIEAVHRSTSLPLDVHMMVEDPERYIEHVAKAGGSIFTVHWEATPHLDRVVSEIKKAGMRAGVAINPATPAVMLEEILPSLDLVLVMSINPGWGGQPFMPSVLPKLRKVRAMIDERSLATELEVDGGVRDTTIKQAVEAGANVLVAGTAVFTERESVHAAVARLRKELDTVAPPA